MIKKKTKALSNYREYLKRKSREAEQRVEFLKKIALPLQLAEQKNTSSLAGATLKILRKAHPMRPKDDQRFLKIEEDLISMQKSGKILDGYHVRTHLEDPNSQGIIIPDKETLKYFGYNVAYLAYGITEVWPLYSKRKKILELQDRAKRVMDKAKADWIDGPEMPGFPTKTEYWQGNRLLRTEDLLSF